MWEKRISHSGLKAFRLVKGQTEADVELKAQLQLTVWEERWARVQLAEANRNAKAFAKLDIAQKKNHASSCTRDAEEQRTLLSHIVANGIELDQEIDWEVLKDRRPFPEANPTKPSEAPAPRRPLKTDTEFAPELSFWDRIIPSLGRKKVDLCANKFRAAEAAWLDLKKKAEEQNAKLETEFENAVREWETRKSQYEAAQTSQHEEINGCRQRYLDRDESVLKDYWDSVLNQSEYPDNFPKSWNIEYVSSTKTLVLDYELPNIGCIPTLKELKYVANRNDFHEALLPDASVHRLYDDVIYQVCLRTIYELFQSDAAQGIDSIVFNGWVEAVDRAVGQEVRNCILSLQVGKPEFMAINLSQVEPKACFKKLKGVSAAKLADLTPVRPILQLNKEDKRFVAAYEVVDTMGNSTNLASMDWQDFENLIREVFEKEFSQNGGEVKITRASRDGGVDAVAFDPDPIRGGKIVIQAKRYTNVVGVSAVRDLYGTVMNEGATKGILVTTADYGQDSYDFAKGKPLTLLSGSELLYLLQKHGHQARIDLAEAKKIAVERERAHGTSTP
jgi:restriction system protein